uniref:Uncharacterized protein n=1 Tax=Arundo donax TaxID=35708 RepID=A0A0A9AW19_ARUDO
MLRIPSLDVHAQSVSVIYLFLVPGTNYCTRNFCHR